jgi:hypothetical protein
MTRLNEPFRENEVDQIVFELPIDDSEPPPLPPH